METPYSGPERRRTPRLAISLSASLRERGRPAFAVRLVDLTTLGCRLELYSDLAAGSWVWLKLPGLEPRYGRLAWCRGGFAGVEFEEPLHELVVDVLAGVDREPDPDELAELRRISERCRALAARLDPESGEDEATSELLALAAACEDRADRLPR